MPYLKWHNDYKKYLIASDNHLHPQQLFPNLRACEGSDSMPFNSLLPLLSGERLRHALNEPHERLPRAMLHLPLPDVRGRVRNRLLQEAGILQEHRTAQGAVSGIHQGV